MKLKVISVSEFTSQKSGKTFYNIFVQLADGRVGKVLSDKPYTVGSEVQLTVGTDNQCNLVVRIVK